MDYIKAFAAYWLMSLILAAGVGMVVGAVAGAILGGAGADIGTIQLVCGVLGGLVGIPVQFVCFRFIVGKFIVQKTVSRLG